MSETTESKSAGTDLRLQAPHSPKESKAHRFNIGGAVFPVCNRVLNESSTLRRCRNRLPRDSEGRCFLDRDPLLFKALIDWVHDAKKRIPDSVKGERRALLAEARFYDIRPLVSQLLEELGIDMDAPFDLNVGGKVFQTTRRVLTEGPPSGTLSKFAPRHCTLCPSALARMFGGSQPLLYTPTGQVFLDSDSDTFEIILKFLETGFIDVPPDFRKLDALWEDCSSFGLVDMMAQGMEPGNVFEGRGEVRCCWAEEVGDEWVSEFGCLPGQCDNGGTPMTNIHRDGSGHWVRSKSRSRADSGFGVSDSVMVA